MIDVLNKICQQKRTLIDERSLQFSESYLEQLADRQSPPRGFVRALKNSLNSGSYGLIAEIKRASPSSGLIRQEFNIKALARSYELGGATCLSVLTDTPNFQGDDQHLVQTREAVDLPVIRKDFMIDPYQILESRAIGADCVLIIMAALSNNTAKNLYRCAKDLSMDVLVEVHNDEEMERALDLVPDLVGINNRNLKSLKVDLKTTERLIPMIPDSTVVVSESGLHNNNDLRRMSAVGANCFLVGETLMRQKDLTKAVKELLGDNTHCKPLTAYSYE